MNEDRWAGLKSTLDRLHDWPGLYTFKFVVPTIQLGRVLEAAADCPFSTRYSKNGRFVSLSATMRMESSEDVVAVYRALEGIPDLMSL